MGGLREFFVLIAEFPMVSLFLACVFGATLCVIFLSLCNMVNNITSCFPRTVECNCDQEEQTDGA